MAAFDRNNAKCTVHGCAGEYCDGRFVPKYDTLEKFANADIKELEQDIKPTGFYHNKSKEYHSVYESLGGTFPRRSTSESGRSDFPGRRGAENSKCHTGNIYHDASVVVDTHVKRISKRLGLTCSEDPEKIEQDLMKELPEDHWIFV